MKNSKQKKQKHTSDLAKCETVNRSTIADSLPPLLMGLKRPFRWTFNFVTRDTFLSEEQFVRSLELPRYVVDRDERKAIRKIWSPLSVTYYDVAGQNNELWKWILSQPDEPTAATIKYWDGCGYLLEELIFQIDPREIRFSDPDYSSSNESTITVVFNTRNVERVTHLPNETAK